MSEAIFLPLFLAFGVFFLGYYGFATDRWSYRVYTFGFAPVAGLLLGFAVMKMTLPGLSLRNQMVVSLGAMLLMVLVLLLIHFLLQRRQ
jgi:hypothetical protein